MGRRKRATIEDDIDSSGDSAQDDYDGEQELDGDERAERALFENPYQQRKRRRLNGKDDATYGVFAEEEDDPPRYARAKRAKCVCLCSMIWHAY
jgi:tuftelin-interacting protein 11